MASGEPDLLMSDSDGLDRLIGPDQWVAGRVRYLPRSTPADIETVRLGIVFVMAWWSGPARKHWVELKRCVKELDPDARLQIVALDIDGMTEFERTVLGPTIAGAGETAWIKDGMPVVPKWVYWGNDVIRVNTRLFVEGRELFVPKYASD